MIALSEVPENKKILWYFDPDMCHDLIWIYNVGYIVIERAVIANYSWAVNFSEHLFQDLLPYSYANTFSDPNTGEEYERYSIPCENTAVNTTVTLPNENDKKLVITWLYFAGDIAHDCTYDTKPFLIKRHHRIYPCNGQEIHLHFTCCKYSVVTSGVDIQIDLGDADYNNYIPFQWNSNIDNVYGSEYQNITPPTHGALEDFSAGQGNIGVTRAVARGQTGVTTYPSTAVGKVPHGLLIFAKPQYSKVSNQGINENIVLGNPPLRVLNESILQGVQIETNYTVQPAFVIVPVTEILGTVLSNRLYPYGLALGGNYSLTSRLEVWIGSNPVLSQDGSTVLRQPQKVTDNLFFWEVGGEVTYPTYSAGYEIVDAVEIPVRGGGVQLRPSDEDLDRLRNAPGTTGFVSWTSIGNGKLLISFTTGNTIIYEREITINYGSPLKGKPASVRYDLFRITEIVSTSPASLDYDPDDDPWLWNDLLEAREHYHNRINTLKNIVSFDKKIDILPIIDTNDENPVLLYNTYIRPLIKSNKSLPLIVNQLGVNPFKQLQGFDFTGGGSGGESIQYTIPITEDAKFELTIKYIMELSDSLRIQEIHACLGADEFAYQDKEAYEPEPRVTNIGWLTNRIALALGISYKPDGKIMSVRRRKAVSYTDNEATLPSGWGRGQFSVNKGGNTQGQTGGEANEDRLGIAYQNRCNKYENFDDNNPETNTLARGDIILCENIPQYLESLLEDLDKGLNWQEMGTGVIPSADGTGFCTFEGLGTLVAEISYMLSSLSNNIYESHTLNLMTYNTTLELLKAIGVPTGVGYIPVDVGVKEVIGDANPAQLIVPKVAEDSPNITTQLYNLLANLSLLIGAMSDKQVQDDQQEQQ